MHVHACRCEDGAIQLLTLRPDNISNDDTTSAFACAGVIHPFEFSPPLSWRCDRELQAQSFWLLLPLPFLILAAVVLPIGLFWRNAHPTTINKCLLWTPMVRLHVHVHLHMPCCGRQWCG